MFILVTVTTIISSCKRNVWFSDTGFLLFLSRCSQDGSLSSGAGSRQWSWRVSSGLGTRRCSSTSSSCSRCSLMCRCLPSLRAAVSWRVVSNLPTASAKGHTGLLQSQIHELIDSRVWGCLGRGRWELFISSFLTNGRGSSWCSVGSPLTPHPWKTIPTVICCLLSSLYAPFCLHLSRCGWVEHVAVSEHRWAKLPAEGLLSTLAAPSKGKPIIAHTDRSHGPRPDFNSPVCFSQQVNLLPELMQAFSDAGGGACLFLSLPHLTGEWDCVSLLQPKQEIFLIVAENRSKSKILLLLVVWIMKKLSENLWLPPGNLPQRRQRLCFWCLTIFLPINKWFFSI